MNPQDKRYVVIIFVVLAALLYTARLFYVQVVEDKYKLTASNQAFKYETEYPPRGTIFDRNGDLLVSNQVAYDLLVVPREMEGCDTAGLCSILNITMDDFRNRLVRLSGEWDKIPFDYRTHVFETQMLPELHARIEERMYKFNGFSFQTRTVRTYKYPIAAHLLGYVGEVSQALCDTNPYYKSGDYIGKSGIERGYEEFLRGTKGVRILMRDVHGNIKGHYMDGLMDTAAIDGKDLTCTLDAKLQLYGEELMKNKIGGICAIEPATGEILALVTSPTYDPNLFVGRDFSKNYTLLVQDTITRPLFNRALMSSYPPGSTFKLMNALIGQQEGVLTPATRYPCAGGYPPLGGKPKCHNHPSPMDLNGSIATSCNSYYTYVFKSILDNHKYASQEDGFRAWRQYVLSFGVGQHIGTDLPFESKGNVPTPEYYDRVFGKGRWKSITLAGAGLGIGQAELGVTPVQMCNIICTIANRGYYHIPHCIKSIEDDTSFVKKWNEKHYTMVTNPDAYANVIEAMSLVMTAGTGRGVAIPGIEMCGKTGTAQNPHGDDHSVFVLFAPRDNPKIAIAVLVENAGFGATYAAPIASLMVEQYLTGQVLRKDMEKRMLEADLIREDDAVQPSPKPKN